MMEKILLVFLSVSLFSFCKSPDLLPFKKDDVRAAQKLIGIDFSDTDIDTMYNYLISNLKGIDSLRRYSPDRELSPAVQFNPFPAGFKKPLAYHEYAFHPDKNVHRPISDDSLAFYTVTQLSQLVKSGQISCRRLAEIYIRRLKQYDPVLHCVISLTTDRALSQADVLDRELAEGKNRGPLHGIPYGLKDLAAVKDYPTTWGSEPYREQKIDYNATVVEKLDSAGAILIAKLSSGALARGDVWFDGQTRNPWDTTQGASGSSAGSASATSAGLVGFSIGTETLGSIISPSSRCGVTGFRPSYGSVSRFGFMTLSWSMDKVGPICRSAEDCAIVFNAIRGSDVKDPMSMDMAFNVDPFIPWSDYRLGYKSIDRKRDTSELWKVYSRTLGEIQSMGLITDSIQLPKDYPFEAFDIILRAESGAFFDELVRSGDVDKMVQQHQDSRANSLRQSRFIPAPEYLQANRHRRALIEEMNTLFEKVDILLIPAYADNISMITNLTGHPAISLPVGIDSKGRPLSLCLIGKLYDDGPMIRLAMDFQKITGYDEMHPPIFNR